MHPNRQRLLEGPIGKSLWILSVPIILSNILQSGYQLTDAFWVGRIGSTAIAAVSVSMPIMFLSMSVGFGLAIAGSTLIAQYFGAKNQKMVDHVAAQTLLMIVAVSVVLGAIGFFLTPAILHAMHVAPDVYQGALGFMRVSFIGFIFNFFFFMFQSVLRGVGETKLPLYIVFGTVLLNFVLDPLFIYGWGPIPGMGVMGAAIATLGTQSIAALIGLRVLLKGKHGIHLALSDFKPDPVFIKRSFFLGLPASIEQSARALGMTVMTFLITSFGTLTVAAYGVGGNLLMVVIIPALGLSMAIATLVGQNIGAGNMKRASDIGRFGSWVSFWVLTALGLIAFIFARHLIAFFVPGDEAVIAEGTRFLRIMAFSWGFIGVQMALLGVLRAAGNMMLPMMLSIISQWVVQLPLALILAKHTSFGISGLWWSFTTSNVVMVIITIAIYSRGTWKTRKLTQQEKEVEKATEEILIEEGVRG
jgi:putative MATE family efflux protein